MSSLSLCRAEWRAVLACLVVATAQCLGDEMPVGQTVDTVANRLERSQVAEGEQVGSWPGEESLAGPATAGMVCAYEWTGNRAYWFTARAGAYYILGVADLQGNLLGDEAYAFVRMSQVFSSENVPGRYDVWRGALAAFYESVRSPHYEGSTAGYLQHYDETEPSTTVFYLAHHVVAAYYVNDRDKQVWRDALIRHLSRVDDQSDFPVMALGAAVWALASINGLDETPVTLDPNSSRWAGVLLMDLPALLLGHQVAEGKDFAGSFYWRFDHTAGGSEGVVAGYTEDAIYGLLGLLAWAELDDGPPAGETVAITSARDALLGAVDTDGRVYEHVSCQGQAYHAFAGELLQALWAVKEYIAHEESATSEQQAPAPRASESP